MKAIPPHEFDHWLADLLTSQLPEPTAADPHARDFFRLGLVEGLRAVNAALPARPTRSAKIKAIISASISRIEAL